MKLTPPQRRLLEHADRRWRPGGELADRMHHAGSREGLHSTAASLVRHGYLQRARLRGIVHYQLTDRGAELLAAEASLRRQNAGDVYNAAGSDL